MAGQSVATGSTLQCPHGGTVRIAGANVRAKAGDPFATAADGFTITGCPFQIPAVVPIPSPCVLVRWLVPDARVKVNGSASLSRSDAGLCFAATQVPQGSVAVVSTQPSASSS